MARERRRDSLRGRDVDRSIERMARERERRGPVETHDDSVLSRLSAGAKTVAAKVGPVVAKAGGVAASFTGETGSRDKSFAARAGRRMRQASANAQAGGGGMGMGIGSMPFSGGLPSAPGFGGGGFGPRERAPRKKGGSRTTIHTGGKTITITSGGGKKKKRKGGGSGSVPPWDPRFRLPY